MDKFVGKRLDGRYEIQEIIGVGGMAVVYKAHDNQEKRTVAIKILKEEFLSNEEFLRRFKNESKAIAMLAHQNIVKVYDVSFGDLIQYIVMEYIEGITLKEFIEHEGSLRWKDAVHFTIQILKALQHAHDKGIVHRDVKPQNIMVLSDGTIKVTDFGIARFARSDQRTITDRAIGSVHYISPEQAKGEKTDEKADIYSVGVMLYEMITGKLPFQAESAVSVAIMQLQRDPQLPTDINGSIPLGLEQITMRAMQKTPERRYQSAGEMLCDLAQFRKDPTLTFENAYFVDNSPTRFVGGVGKSIPEVSDNYNEPSQEVAEKGNIIPILTGIAVAVIIAIIVLCILFVPKLFSATGDEIPCPNFIGETYTDIKDNAEYNENFNFVEKWEKNDDFAYGIIYQQSENAGEMLKKDAEITLYISMGQSTKKVPNVYEKTESAAVSELETAGFKTVVVEEPSEDVTAGLVTRTEPKRTEVVPEGAEITIYISTGKPTKNVKVPDVVSMPMESAEKLLKAEGLTVKVEKTRITVSDDFLPVDYVVKQECENTAAEVPEGTEVVIYVCEGYKFDIEIELPKDYVNKSYTVSLWEDGKLVNKGAKVNPKDNSKYTFKDITSTSKLASYTVKIDDEYDLYGVAVDMSEKKKEDKVTLSGPYDDYKNADESNDSSGGNDNSDSSNSSDSSKPKQN